MEDLIPAQTTFCDVLLEPILGRSLHDKKPHPLLIESFPFKEHTSFDELVEVYVYT